MNEPPIVVVWSDRLWSVVAVTDEWADCGFRFCRVYAVLLAAVPDVGVARGEHAVPFDLVLTDDGWKVAT